MSQKLHIQSPAKINLSLRVLRKRRDGYHDIETVFQTISLADRMELEWMKKGVVIRCDREDIPAGKENIIFRAVALLREEGCRIPGIKIDLFKRIPPGSGLGGGSSNAASILLGLNRWLSLGIAPGKMAEMASRLGSDVPFFLWGGTAVGRGRGNEIFPLRFAGRFWISLATFRRKIATASAYSKLSPLLTKRKNDTNMTNFIYSIFKGKIDFPLAENDFERLLLEKNPDLRSVRRLFVEFGARQAMLTGSGSAFYGLFDDRCDAERAASAARKAGVCSDCLIAETIDSRSCYERMFR